MGNAATYARVSSHTCCCGAGSSGLAVTEVIILLPARWSSLPRSSQSSGIREEESPTG